MNKCDLCNNRPCIAIKFRNKEYLYLCNHCWKKVKIFTTGNRKIKKGKKCPVCKYTIEEFNKYGFLGCDFCYEYFYNEVISYLKKLHISIFYRGKYPEKFKNLKNRWQKIFTLRNSIDKIEIRNGKFHF
jgi:protein arginine kinase activator